ncbi:MAG: allophanate hydrolase subunit 2 family protein, partial [Fusobacterium sp.]
METLKITDSGLLSSIQDLGRYGYQRYGVSCSGVMDEYAAKIGNKLVGNNEDAAVIETTLKGISGEFLADTIISVTGGQCDVSLNGEKIELWKSHSVKAGDILKMGFCKSGLRNYIAFSGGIDV